MAITAQDLRLDQTALLRGKVVTLDMADGDDGLLPDGELYVTLHVTLADQPTPQVEPTPIGGSTYSKVYSAAHEVESERPLAERTRYGHDVAADAVASHALLDLIIAMEESDPAEHPFAGLDEMVAFIRDRAHRVDGALSSTLARHEATHDVVKTMTPAYAAWVSRNSPAVKRRLEDFVDEQLAQVLLAHFHISEKTG
ncbi:hypothetical protein [Microbacterium sp. 77mftsu3.1]|uniref:hypothetical protein n=1 Tax=Microbacterium sp. 77mftsu3.1 TaxID=1761802 RepID=UPI00035EAF88|nr:hypothetical protein [Microbacterium sp. 77mftsu3.1]SDH39092.1 hypothetical protein SAMN04488590_3213 [Microbacterium sp. 77mftsu3.1]